MDFTLVD